MKTSQILKPVRSLHVFNNYLPSISLIITILINGIKRYYMNRYK